MLPLGSCATEYFPAWRMIGWDLETGDLVRTLQSRSHCLTPSCQVSNRSCGWSQFCWAAGISGRLPRRTPSRVDGTATTLRPVLASWCPIPPPHSATSIHAPPRSTATGVPTYVWTTIGHWELRTEMGLSLLIRPVPSLPWIYYLIP